MRILFDHQVFSWQKYGGISRYFAEIIRGVTQCGETALLPFGFYTQNVHLRDIAGIEMHPICPFPFKGIGLVQNYFGKRTTLRSMFRERPDILHPTYYDPYFLGRSERLHIPFVLTVHDMIHEIFDHRSKSLISLDAVVVGGKKRLAEKAAAIITVSENTRRDLLQLYPDIDPDKVRVIWHGNSLIPDLRAPFRLDLPERYILFVGNRKAYKNFSWFVRDISTYLLKNKRLHLVCAGSAGFDPEERQLLRDLQIDTITRHLPFGNDQELAEIYRRAICFVFPSGYEGFGIPVLESFACGCPAILNRASSLPEVGGDAVLYFDKNEKGSLIQAIDQVVDSAPKRQEMQGLGFARVKKFSWENSVTQHLNVYRAAAGRR